MNPDEKLPVLVTCGRGVSTWLAAELTNLGFPALSVVESGVRTNASLNDCMKLNLELRLGHRVLLQIAECRARDANMLYAKLAAMPWSDWLFPTYQSRELVDALRAVDAEVSFAEIPSRGLA